MDTVRTSLGHNGPVRLREPGPFRRKQARSCGIGAQPTTHPIVPLPVISLAKILKDISPHSRGQAFGLWGFKAS